jgi:hypothetical protein
VDTDSHPSGAGQPAGPAAPGGPDTPGGPSADGPGVAGGPGGPGLAGAPGDPDLDEGMLAPDPVAQFSGWLAEAAAAGLDDEGITALFLNALRDFRERGDARAGPRVGRRERPGRREVVA